jgi:hypothetical protein
MSVLDARFSAGEPAARLYEVSQVAGMLGVHPETIRRLIHDPLSVEAFVDRQRVKPFRA